MAKSMRPTQKKEREIIQKVMEAYRSSYYDPHRQYKQEIWKKCYNNYMGILPQKVAKRSNLFIPVTYQTIETMVAREMSIIYNENGLFQFEGRKSGDVEAAEAITKFANFDIRRVPSSYEKIANFLRQLHIYGTSVLKVYWKWEETLRPNGDLEVLYDGFDFDVIPVRNVYVDPMAKSLSEARWVMTRTIMDIEEFKSMMKKIEVAKLSKEDLQKVSESGVSVSVGADGRPVDELDYASALAYDPERRFVEILEYFSEEEDRHIMIAGEQMVIRDRQLPYKHKKIPLLFAHDTPDPEHFYGFATAESIFDLQAELNATRNHRMDKKNFTMNPMFIVSHEANLKRESLISKQGGIIRVRDAKNDLQPFQPGQMDSSDYQEESIIKQDIQTTSSINDFALGQTSKGFNDTATGVSIIDANAQSRIIGKVSYIEKEVLEPMALQWLGLQKQFMRPNEVFMVSGEEVRINKLMLEKEYSLKASASTRVQNKQVRQNAMMQLAQLVSQDPAVNHIEWLKALFNAFEIPYNKLIMEQASQIPPDQALALVQANAQAPMGADPNAMNMNGGERAMDKAPYDFAAGQPVG